MYFFKVIIKLKIQDSDVQEKYKFVQKVIKERAFLQAIAREDENEKIDLNDIFVFFHLYCLICFLF